MRNLRNRYTYEQRKEFANTIAHMKKYIVPLLLDRQNNVCALCHESHAKYDIDHLIYNPMVSMAHVRLLCIPCHKKITNFTTFKNRTKELGA